MADVEDHQKVVDPISEDEKFIMNLSRIVVYVGVILNTIIGGSFMAAFVRESEGMQKITDKFPYVGTFCLFFSWN